MDFCMPLRLRPPRKALPFHFGYDVRVLDRDAHMSIIHIHSGPHTLKYSFTCSTVLLVAFM